MTLPRFRRVVHASLLALLPFCPLSIAQAQGAKKTAPPEIPTADTDADHVQERSEWFLRGRVLPGKSAAELRHKAYQAKMRARSARTAHPQVVHPDFPPPPSAGAWTALGPVPLASDASGGFQDYHQVSGRATAVAIDPSDPTGNTVYIGGAQGGVWKSTNAASSNANNVTWTAITDDQATLSIGSIVIQPGNSDPAKSVILVAQAKRTIPATLISDSASCVPPMAATPGRWPPPQTALAARSLSADWALRAWLSAQPQGRPTQWSQPWRPRQWAKKMMH